MVLSPIWVIGLTLLLSENYRYRKYQDKFFNINWKRSDLVLIGLGAAFEMILILGGAPWLTILGILISLIILIFFLSQKDSRSLKKQNKIADLEFGALLSIFSIYISAGLSPAQSLVRIVDTGQGYLISELSQVVNEIRNGSSALKAMEKLAIRTSSQPLRRFLDSLIISMERGTSLNEVLARQISEVRGENRARLVETAAKSEITLMIPIILLILPVSILFALWPSYVSLGKTIGF